MTREFIRAFKSGSTRPTSFFLAVASLVQATQFLLADMPMMATRQVALSYVAHPSVWGALHVLAAMLILWRLVDTVRRPVAAWVVNAMVFWVWVCTYISPAVAFSDVRNLVSIAVVLPAMAAWVLVRTEATIRDKVNA